MILIKKIQTLALGGIAVSSATAVISYLTSSNPKEPEKVVVKPEGQLPQQQIPNIADISSVEDAKFAFSDGFDL